MGKVLSLNPLGGDENDPLRPIPLRDIAKEYGIEGIGMYYSLDYNVKEGWVDIVLEATPEAHIWLEGMNLEQEIVRHGWKLDKTALTP